MVTRLSLRNLENSQNEFHLPSLFQIKKNGRWWSRPAISSLSPNGLSTLGSRIIRSSVFVRAIRFYSALRGFPETAGPSVMDRTLQVVVHTKYALPVLESTGGTSTVWISKFYQTLLVCYIQVLHVLIFILDNRVSEPGYSAFL